MIDLSPPIIYEIAAPNEISKAEILAKKYLYIDTTEELVLFPLDGGLTCSTYQFTHENITYVLKFLNRTTELSTLLREMWIFQLASEYDVAPKIVHFDLEERAILMHFAPGTPLDLDDVTSARQALLKLKLMHNSLPNQPFAAIKERGAKILENKIDLASQLTHALEIVAEIEKLVNLQGIGPTLCHSDFHTGNILTDGNEAWLIDWSSANFGHPYYDIAKLTYKLDFEPAKAYLRTYLERDPNEKEKALFYMIRLLCHMTIATNRYLKAHSSSEQLQVADTLTTQFLKMTSSETFQQHKNILSEFKN